MRRPNRVLIETRQIAAFRREQPLSLAVLYSSRAYSNASFRRSERVPAIRKGHFFYHDCAALVGAFRAPLEHFNYDRVEAPWKRGDRKPSSSGWGFLTSCEKRAQHDRRPWTRALPLLIQACTPLYPGVARSGRPQNRFVGYRVIGIIDTLKPAWKFTILV